jgi:hypothetical protein
MPQQSLDIPGAPEDMKNQDVRILYAVDEDVLTHGKTTKAKAQILIAPSPDVWWHARR